MKKPSPLVVMSKMHIGLVGIGLECLPANTWVLGSGGAWILGPAGSGVRTPWGPASDGSVLFFQDAAAGNTQDGKKRKIRDSNGQS
jgi:hypothetical protein